MSDRMYSIDHAILVQEVQVLYNQLMGRGYPIPLMSHLYIRDLPMKQLRVFKRDFGRLLFLAKKGEQESANGSS
jgi:hypothetical protein